MTTKNQVAAQAAQSTALISDDVPEFLRNQTQARGAEDVGAEDLVIPRLELVQSLSPCRKPNDPEYIQGAVEGMLYNNVTRKLYEGAALIVPVKFKKEYLIWKDRKKGGGFRGAFATLELAERHRATLEDGADCESIDTAQHFCLIVDPNTGKAEEIVLSMSRSKMKVSRNFNSLIRLNGGDSFSRVYRITGVLEKNDRNEDYYNFKITPAGYPTEALYKQAEALYEMIQSGQVVADRSETGQTVEHGSGEY